MEGTTMETANVNLNAALDYLQRGWPIVLCDGKTPLGKEWQSRVYTNDSIRAEFGANSALNPGLILGDCSGVTDIEGDDENSEADFRELFDGVEPLTPKYQSKRSIHRLFKYDPRLALLGKSVGKWKSLEIRGCGNKACQSVLPPSSTDGFAKVVGVAGRL